MRARSSAILAALLLAAVSGLAAQPPAVGQQAPVFTLKDQNGHPVTLSGALGRKVVLVFYRGYW